MSWSYRVVGKMVGGESSFGIHEVYVDEEGTERGLSWTVESIPPRGVTLEQLRQEMEMMRLALWRPVMVEREGTLVEDTIYWMYPYEGVDDSGREYE